MQLNLTMESILASLATIDCSNSFIAEKLDKTKIGIANFEDCVFKLGTGTLKSVIIENKKRYL